MTILHNYDTIRVGYVAWKMLDFETAVIQLVTPGRSG